MRRMLFENEHLLLEEDPEQKIVFVTRTASSAGGGEGVLASYEKMVELLRPSYKQYGLLIDATRAPGRNDPEFEAAIARLVARIEHSFARRAILLASAAGELQARRMERARGNAALATFITRDREAAIAFAAGPRRASA